MVGLLTRIKTRDSPRESPRRTEPSSSPERTPDLARPRSSSTAPKLVLISDDDDEQPRRRSSLVEELHRTVSGESGDTPSRATTSNGFTSFLMSDASAGPSDGASLTLDHLVGGPEITLRAATPDLSNTLAPSKSRSRASSISENPTITPSSSSATISTSALAPTNGTAPPPTPIVSPAKKSTLAADSPTRPRSASVRKPRSPSGSSGIAGALAASGMALAAHTSSAPGMGTRSQSQTTDGDSDGASLDSGQGSGGSLRPIPSMDVLSLWDGVGTGYALASTRRNADFHQLFGSVPEDDYLVEDYGCALARDILIQGRIYVSEHHLCFYANIFGWITSHAIPFSEIVSIEKRMTALVIPNAIQVATLHSRYQFASFLSRDTTYDLIISIWRIIHPTVPSTAALPDTALSEAEEADDHADGEDDDGEEKKEKRRLLGPKRRGRKSTSAASPTVASSSTGAGKSITIVDSPTSAGLTGPGSPRSAAPHAPTTCRCGSGEPAHFTNVCMDAQFATTPEKLYNLMFTSGFIKTFWSDNQKLFDISLSDWAPSSTPPNRLTRNTQYIKPLNASVGPKQTKCLITDECVFVDFDEHVTILTTTRNPDVPSGGAFEVKTKTCITWARNGHARVLVTTQVDWLKSSFLKGIITASATTGQKAYHADLEKEMRSYILAHRGEFFDGSTANNEAAVEVAGAEEEAAERQAETNASSLADAAARGDSSKSRFVQLARFVPESLRPVAETVLECVGLVGSMILSIGVGQLSLFLLLALLALGNAWSMIRGIGSGPRGPPTYGSMSGGGSSSETGHEVALAVRGVLEEYFAKQQAAMVSSSPVEWKKVARELRAEVEMLEARVTRLKVALDELD